MSPKSGHLSDLALDRGASEPVSGQAAGTVAVQDGQCNDFNCPRTLDRGCDFVAPTKGRSVAASHVGRGASRAALSSNGTSSVDAVHVFSAFILSTAVVPQSGPLRGEASSRALIYGQARVQGSWTWPLRSVSIVGSVPIPRIRTTSGVDGA